MGTVDPRFGISATARGVTGNARAAVKESRRVGKIVLTPEPPDELRLAVGSTARFHVEAVDLFNACYELPIMWSAIGTVQVSSNWPRHGCQGG